MKRIQIDVRLVVAAILAVAAGAVVHAVTRPAPQVDVLVAEAPLPPGTRLGDLPVVIRPMTPSPGLVLAEQATALADHSLAAPLSPGDPLLASLLIAPPTDRPDVAALSLDPAHAVQGDLVAGDRVDVYVSHMGVTELLAPDVLVLAATVGSGGLGGSDVSLLVAVDRELAIALVEAIHTAEIDLVRRPR